MKTKSHLLTAACVAALVFCGPSLAFAATKKSASPSPSPGASAAPTAKASATAKASPTPAAKGPRAIPFRGTATKVDQSAKTFTVAGLLTSRVFKLTDKTTVTKDGKTATLAELTENEKVTGSYWKQGDGTLELKSLKIGGKTEDEKTTKKSKKSKKADAAASASPAVSPSTSPKK